MADKLGDLILFPQKVSLSLAERGLVDLLHGYHLTGILVEALVYRGKFTVT